MTSTIPLRPTVLGVEPASALTSVARERRWTEVGLIGAIASVAFVARLVPVLRGGGLSGLISYDGSVYYTAAVGLANGLLPYRDYLLLHPPGIVLALLPFAALGRLIGHAPAATVATVVWMGLGALNAVLASRIVRPHGRSAAAIAGLSYAVFYPAIRVDGATTLETVTSLGLFAAVLLVTRAVTAGSGAHPGAGRMSRLVSGAPPFVLAGALLGASAGVKIWGVVLAATMVVWSLVSIGRRAAGVTLLGAGIGVTAVCLPFFMLAPASMWRMVVLDQLGRGRASTSGLDKLTDLLGLSRLDPDAAMLAAALVGLAVAMGCALRSMVGRLGVVLLGASWVVLWASPSWSVDYASLGAAPLALVLGAAVGGFPARRIRAGTSALLGVMLAVTTSLSLVDLRTGEGFPSGALRSGLLATPGCVTSDFPTALIETGVLQRNLDRGCPLMADLGGYSYDLRPGADRHVGRARNPQWQQFALDYLSSGDATLLVRFRHSPGYSASSRTVIDSWPATVRAGRFSVQQPTRRPQPHG